MSQFPIISTLTNLSRERALGTQNGVGTIIAPLFRSATGLTGQYPKWKRKRGTNDVDIQRAPGAEVKRTQGEGFDLEPYALKDHSIEIPTPIEFNTQGGGIVSLEQERRDAMKATRMVMEAHERAVNTKFWATNEAGFNGIYTAGNVQVPATKWSAAGATIKKNIMDGQDIVEDKTGKVPNTLLLTNTVFNTLMGADNEIREAIKYTQFGSQTAEILARYLEIDRVIVPRFLVDAANPGQAENFGKLWSGKHALLFYADPNPGLESDTLGLTFFYDEPGSEMGPFMGTRRYYEEKTKSMIHQTSAYFDVKVFDQFCGFAFPDCIA